MKKLNIKELLVAWARWSKQGGTRYNPVNIGYKSTWDRLLPSSHGIGMSIDYDDEMMKVDRAMRWLKDRSPFDYKLLKLKYLYGYSYKRIARKLTKQLPQYRKTKTHMCDKYAKSLVDLAENTIESKLNS